MRFAVLGSGSRGNATLVSTGKTCVMVDCGFSVRETEQRLARLAVEPDTIDALLVTHEHTDHSRGVGAFARKHGIPVWTTRGTAGHANFGELPQLNRINAEQGFELADLQVQSYPVPHDAREPCQFCFSNGDRKISILTDSGCTTMHIEQMISGSDALMLECNHDLDMLWKGAYPQRLKQRVAGRYGHLSNAQAAELIGRIDTSKLNRLVAVHLSEKNNTQVLARDALSEALGCDQDWIQVAGQDDGLAWQSV